MTSPLIGRDVEVARLHAALDESMGGEGRLVLISGEPGIGKTRLVEEVAALACHEGAQVAWGRVDEVEGAPPYSPWIQLLESLLEDADRQAVCAALGANAGTLAAIVPVAKEFQVEITPPPVLDPAEARFHLYTAIVEFLRGLGERRRLVLILDDAHGADVSSLELTRFVAARLRTLPVLLLVTYRSADPSASASFDDVLGVLARQPCLERIELQGLSQAEVGRFMAQTVGLRPRRAVIERVHAQTEGNPFFIEELTRLLQNEGNLGTGRLADTGAVPAGVRDVVRRRLARLPAGTNDLLVLAAVVGREFDLATLAETAGRTETEVVDGLEPAISARIVLEAQGPLGHLRFSHALIRDTIYGQLSALRRASLHAQVGSALERRHGTAPSKLAERAWHFFHAASVVGPDPGLAYCVDAAEAAQSALAYERAEEDLRRALTLVELLPAGRDRLVREIQVQDRLATLLTARKGLSSADTADAWRRSRRLHTELGDARALLIPLFGLYIVHCTRADHRSATAIGEQLLDLGAAVSDAALLMAGHQIVGMECLERGLLAAARDHLERSMDLMTGFDDPTLACIFPMHPGGFIVELAVVDHLLGDEEGCEARRAQANAVRDRISQPLHVGPGLILDLQLQISRGAFETMPEDAASAARRCRTWGLTEMAAVADFWGTIAQQRRDGRDRTRELDDALSAVDQSGFRIWRTQHLALLAEAHRQAGHIDQAVRLVDEGLAEADRNDERFWEPELLRLRGELLLTSGSAEAAAAAIDEAIALAGAQGSTTLQRRAEASRARVQVQAPRWAPASRGDAPEIPPALSPREQRLLGLIGQGFSDKEIAAELGIALATVRSHLDRIRDKTGCRRRPELSRLADRLGLTTG